MAVTGAALLIVGGCGESPQSGTGERGPAVAQFVGSELCADCHPSEFERWQGSHHNLAMQPATDETVLGDFGDAEFEYFDVVSQFFTRDGGYWIRTDNASGELEEFEILYTFGVTPLQQYLVAFPDGRLQALSIAWDARAAELGGQRWMHLYPDEFIRHDDRLHWTGNEQNWNYQCAECHSTDLQKNFDLQTDTFATTWSEVSVGCEACHGPASLHVSYAAAGTLESDNGLTVDLDDRGAATWIMNPDTGIAGRSAMRMQPPAQPEACGRCHARRSLVSSGYQHGLPLTETHLPALLTEILYFPDGQIRDEVYVYGSFLQSRMYQAGVSCGDCHEPHSATLRTSGPVSDICSTCHLPERFASTGHQHHEPGSVECVDCHMASRDYMVVDGRRDHSFRIPRPDLTLQTGAPNACSSCHQDQSAKWADDAIRGWFGGERPAHYATAIHAGRNADANANTLLLAAIGNTENAGIARATALTLLRPPLTRDAALVLRSSLSDGDALIRIGALRAMLSLPAEVRLEWAVPLLRDRSRAVRIEAARILSDARDGLPPPQREHFRRAELELVDAQLAIAERTEANGNLGNLFRDAGQAVRAEQFYLLALRQEPRNTAARANLADFYRLHQRDQEAERVLREGLTLDDSAAPLHHALGLLLVRRQSDDAAVSELELASRLDPANSRYSYVYAIALNSTGQGDAARDVLQEAQQQFPGDFDIGWTLVTLLRDQGRMDEAREQAALLDSRFPGNENVTGLLRSLAEE